MSGSGWGHIHSTASGASPTPATSFDGERRFANARDISAYIDGLEQRGSALDFEETLGPDEVTRETLFLSLRQRAGMHYAQLIELKGEEGAEWTERGTTEGWLAISEGRVAFTPAGFLLSNEYLSQLF
jgi:coproporphyrinogen III oxidase-like Fe-S oxidoreductase